MVPKSMSSEVENIEIKRKNNTDKRAGQIQFVRVSILT